MAGYTSKFNASSNKNTSFLPGMSIVDINALYVSAAGAINEVKENLEEFGDQVVETATEVKDNVVEFGNDVADTLNAGVDKVQTFFTSTVDGKDTKLFDFHPKKKGEFYLEDYTNLDFSKYESMYDSEEIVDYLQELTVNTSYEIYKNQQTIDFYQQFLDAYHSEAWLNTNYVRIDDFPDLYEKWLTEMDEKMHADWYADPEKYATQIAYLESTRKARMDSSCGGVPPSLVDEVIMLSAEREYRNIIDANCSDEKMHRDPDFENIYNSYKESYEGFKGASDYTMEKYGVSGDEYYYYFIDAQVNGESIIGSLTNANYNMKQGLDLEPFEQIKLSEGFVNANIDTKFDYAGNYSFFLDDYGKSYFWNEDYLKETYGVESKEDWELMKKTQFMEESDRELYFYLLGKDESLAQEFLDAHEDQINQSIACVKTLDELEESGIISYNKELAEQKLEAALAQDPNLDVKAFRNQCRIDTTCYEINTGGAMDVINDYADSLGFGVRDGVIQWGEGIGNAICADGIKSVKDYQRMYMVQILSQGENSRELLNETYQFGVAAGNMLPTVAVGTAVTVASGGNVAAGEAVSKALLVTSAYGNTKEQVMQTYEISRGQAYLYAGASAGLELVMEGKLGSVLPLADKEAASFIEAFVKEGTQEAAQSVLESAMNLTLGEEFDVGNVLTEAIGEGIYGGLVGGTFYGVNHVTSPLVSAGIISNVAKRNNISYVEAKGMYMQYGAEYADSDSKVSFNNYVKTNLAAKPSVNNTVSNIDATTIDAAYEDAAAANIEIPLDSHQNTDVNTTTTNERVADINIDNIDGVDNIDVEYNNTEQLKTKNAVKEVIKPSEENLEFFKENLEQSDYTAMKRVYDVVTEMLNSKDGAVKNIAEHIQNLTNSEYSNEMSFIEHRNIGDTKFANYYRTYLETGLALLTTTNFQLELNASNQVVAHEFGHMLLNLVDFTKSSNYESVRQSTIESLKANDTKVQQFFREADQYAQQFDERAKQNAHNYVTSHPEVFNQTLEEYISSESNIRKLAKDAYLKDFRRDNMLELFRSGNHEELAKVASEYVERKYYLDEYYHNVEYDHEMMQISMVAGVIDSIYEGNNPFLEEHYKPYNLRSHGQAYFQRSDIQGFDEQFADYTAMRIYSDDYAVASTFLRSVLGDEWFNMMDAKFNSISEQVNALGTTVEEETPSVDLGIDIEKDDEGYITHITVDADALKVLQKLVGRNNGSYYWLDDFINDNVTEMNYKDFETVLYGICVSMDSSLSYVRDANDNGYFNNYYEKYQNALKKCMELRGYTVEDIGTKVGEISLEKSRLNFVKNVYTDSDTVKSFINACLELHNARTDYYRTGDLILAKNEISDSFKCFKSDEDIGSFNSEYEELLKNGTVEDVRNYLNTAQQEILDHWVNTVTPIDEYKEGDPFKFICHSVFNSNFKGNFYTRFVSTSLLTDNLTDTYNSGFGFIFNPENIVGAASRDMYIDNAAESTDDLQISTSMPQIDSPEKLISECMELKNKLANEGKEGNVYNEVVIDGFNPAAIFCIIDGTERGYSNYENALKLQEQFPELRVIRLPKNDTIDVTTDYRQVATQNAMDEYYEPTAPIEVQAAPVYDYASAEAANQTINANYENTQSTQTKTSIFDRLRNMTKRDPSVVTEKIEKTYDELDRTSPMELAGVVNMIIDENAYNEFLNNRANIELFDKHKKYDAIMDLVGVINSKGTSLKFSLAEKARLNTLYNLALTDNIENHVDEIVSGTMVPDKRTFHYMIHNELLNTMNPEHINLINEYVRKYADNVINVTDIDAIDNKVLGSNDRFNTVYEYDGKRLTTNEIKDMLDVTTPELKTKILLKAYEYEDPVARARKAYIELNKVLHYDNEYLNNSNLEQTIMDQNQYISFGTLNKRNNVVCLGWAKLYAELLYDLGFSKDQVIMRTNEQKNHYWVELHVDEDTIIIADATEGHVMSNGTYNVDLSACKADDSTTGFFIGNQQMAGHRLSTIYKNIKGEAQHYTPNQIAYLKEQIDNSNNRLLQVDKEINYVNDNGLYNENIAIASARFDQLDDVSDHNESDKAMYVLNMPIPEGMDGYDLFGYYKKVTSSIDSKYIKVSRDCIINENGEAETVAELICTDDRGKVVIKAYSESNGVMEFYSYDELNDFVSERNGR